MNYAVNKIEVIDEVVVSKEEKNEFKIPKGTYFILAAKLAERFSFFLIDSLLIFYIGDLLTQENFADPESKAQKYYHSFYVLSNALVLPAALLSDGLTGAYKAWIAMAMMNILGLILLFFSSFPVLNSSASVGQWPLFLMGYAIYAIGVGGTKILQIIGGDQFKLPKDNDAMSTFFSNLYVFANVGSVAAYFVFPVLKDRPLQLQDSEAKFALILIVSSASFFVATLLMIFGRPHFKIEKPSSPNAFDFFRCMAFGLRDKLKTVLHSIHCQSSSKRELNLSPKKRKTTHWIDVAEEKLGSHFVSDVKVVLHIWTLFATYPVFWTLFYQMVMTDFLTASES